MKHLIIYALLSFLTIGTNNNAPEAALDIFGNSVNLNNNQRNIIIVNQGPCCSVCIKLLSKYFSEKALSDSVNYYTLCEWQDIVMSRRSAVINTESFFPNFTPLFDNKENGFLEYYEIEKYPAIILIDENKKTTVIKIDDIFDESANYSYIKKDVTVMLNNFIEMKDY